MAITAASLGVAAGLELDSIFRDSLDVLQTGEAQYLKNGNPESISGKLSQAAGRSACRIYGTGSVNLNARAAQRYENACRPYLASIGQTAGAALIKPFNGGQCVGVPYGARYTWKNAPTSNPNNYVPQFNQFLPQGRTLYGPLSGFTRIGTLNSQYRVNGFNAAGVADQRFLNQGGTQFGGAGSTVVGLSFERLTGGSVECGEPPPEVRPPTPVPNPEPNPRRFNPGPEIDVDLDVTVNPDGSIVFNIGTGPITVDPFDDEGSGGGGGGGDGDPGDVGEEDAAGAEDADENGNASGCAGEDQVLGGIKIDVNTVPDTARYYAPGIIRAACYIYMGVEGQLDQDFGGSMLRDGQFFLPEKNNLTCWEVQANVGFRLRVTPYYKTLPPEE